MVHSVVLTVHIIAGSLGLLLIPALVLGLKGTALHVRLGRSLLWCLRVIALTALALAAMNFAKLWWFLLIAAGSLALGERGARAWRKPFTEAVITHIGGMGGACIAFVTAVIVVNAANLGLVAWVAPTVIGSVVIRMTINRYLRRGHVGVTQSTGASEEVIPIP